MGNTLTPSDAITRAARLVSIAFYVACLVPVWFLLAAVGVQPEHRWLFGALMLASPFYCYWCRTCTIETTALFFNLSYLAAAMNGQWFAAVPFGCIAALVKINAWPTYAGAAIIWSATTWLS